MSSHPSLHRRLRGDDGAAVLEAALVLPLLFGLLMTAFDLTSLEFRQSQISGAARDGARAGIVEWDNANLGSYSGGSCPSVSPTTSKAFVRICTSVLQRLAGTKVTGITVRCYLGNTTTPVSTTPGLECDQESAAVTIGRDTLSVSVSYTYSPISPLLQTMFGNTMVFAQSNAEAARMVVQ